MFIKTLILKKRILVCIASVFFCFSEAQVSHLPNGVKGYWETAEKAGTNSYNWNAQWIWLPEVLKSDVMLARRVFNLKTKPQEANLRITASSKYELYVNEVYVCQGPARSAAHHQSFDILDIGALLKQGKNNISVRVHHQKGKVSYHLKGRAGLLAQLDFNETTKPIFTNNQWKVSSDPTWDNQAHVINRFQKVVNDNSDFRKLLRGWNTLDFDDTNWQNAIPLLRNSGWPAPKKNEIARALTTPWTSLVPRDIPYLKEKTVSAENLIEGRLINTNVKKNPLELTGRISNEISNQLKGFLRHDKPLILGAIKSDQTWFLLYDFGRVLSGMPKLTIEGNRNTEVSILSAPFIVDNKFTHKIVDSNFQDRLILSGEKDNWQAMYFKPTRYMALVIKGNTEAVKIYDVAIHQMAYPFELNGTIKSPDAPWIEALWDASIKTIDATTTDAFTDNYRERRQYAQTGYYAALGNYFTYGDTALQRRYLIQVAQEQEANGLMPAYAPLAGDDYMVILDSNCLWIRSLYNYLLYSGDYKTVTELLPAAKKLMRLLHTYTNELGLLNNPPYAYWLDHTLNDRRGANFCLNGHYLGALKDFSKLLVWLKDEQSNTFKNRVNLLKASLRIHFWDADKQLFTDAFVDGERSNKFSEHANAMALAEGIATEEQAKLVSDQLLKKDQHNYIKRENGLTMVSPAMSYFLHKGLADNGYPVASLNMLHERFNKMLDSNTNGTLWEEWWRNGTGRTGVFQERTRSDAQTESVFPPALFAKYVLGIKIVKPGMKVVTISKPKFNLTVIDGKIPSPLGMLSVSWSIDENSRLKLSIPDGMIVKVDLNSFHLKDKKQLFLDGKRVKEIKFLELKGGSYEISF